MDHRAPRRLRDTIDIELREDHREARSAVARRGDAFAHRGHQDPIEIGLGHARRPIGNGRGRHDGHWPGLGIAEQAREGRQHACPALALGHPLRRAEGGERDARLGSRDDVPAIEERLQRSPEGAVRERQALGRDRREHGRRACRSGGERVEQIEPEERGGEAGRRGTHHAERSGTPLRVARDVRCRIA